jgi:L-threonylcarbamoyladenylate synthase
LELLAEFLKLGGKGIAAPSANRFGQVSPTTADAVRDELGHHLEKDDVILDGGFSEVGIESTIIDCRGSSPKILRPGSITAEMIEAVTALSVDETQSTIRVSGALENHYAPKAKVILDGVPEAGDGFIAFSNMETPDGVIRLAAPKTLEQFAKELYQSLREADKQSLSRVVIWQPTGQGLAIAIRDRLLRASTKS